MNHFFMSSTINVNLQACSMLMVKYTDMKGSLDSIEVFGYLQFKSLAVKINKIKIILFYLKIFVGVFYISTYEGVRHILKGHNVHSNIRALVAGGAASLVGQTIIVPFDILSQHLMMMGVNGKGQEKVSSDFTASS